MSTPASATPTTDKKRQAVVVKQQVDRLNDQAEVAAERYNEARDRHYVLQVKVDATQASLKKIRGRIGTLQTHLGIRAESMYRSGPLGFVEVLLGASSFEEFSETWDLLVSMNEDEADAVHELKSARAKAKRAERVLLRAKAQAREQADVMASNKREVMNRLATRKSMLRGLESEIAALEAAERARSLAAAREARARLAAAARSSASRYPAPARFDADFGSPTRQPRSQVVSIAMRYLGRPYVWAASGPNSFDCSGFTMYVYRQVGVSLPHSSRAQIGYGERVSRSALQPGDLVFFGSPIHHVGIYVGGNQYIHAPQTGDVVKVSSMNRGGYAGACRP